MKICYLGGKLVHLKTYTKVITIKREISSTIHMCYTITNMRIILLSLVLTIIVTSSFCQTKGSSFVNHVNSKKNTWVARETSLTNMRIEHVKKIMGARPPSNLNMLPQQEISLSTVIQSSIPLSFDARIKWPNCTMIGKIKNQGFCGSCWAFATTGAMSDRICIQTKGLQKLNISAQHLLSCCSNCGEGCDGGYTSESWNFWMKNGIVTGGDFGSNYGCQAYTGDAFLNGTTPACKTQCQYGSNVTFLKDLRQGSGAYSVSNSTMNIKYEILMNGSVTAIMTVYEDFLSYSGGVYQNITGILLGFHAIKLIGWGVLNTVPYWLVANSWGTNWGENGFCKILIGSVGIESTVNAGLAKI